MLVDAAGAAVIAVVFVYALVLSIMVIIGNQSNCIALCKEVRDSTRCA